MSFPKSKAVIICSFLAFTQIEAVIGYTSDRRCNVPYQTDSPQGCIKACSHPDYIKCPTSYVQTNDKAYCGFTTGNTWKDISIPCQGCKDPEIMGINQGKCPCVLVGCPQGQICDGVCKENPCKSCKPWQLCMNNTCVDKCITIKCSAGSVCEKGACLKTDSCQNVSCPQKTKCQKGICIPEGKLCVPKSLDIKMCKLPRPNAKTCPVLNWVKTPDPVVCGVDYSGTRTNYPVECYACKESKNIYYYNGPCLQDHVCTIYEDCVDKQCIAADCSTINCPTGTKCNKGLCQ